MNKIKLNNQEWEAHTRTLPTSQVGHSRCHHRVQVPRANTEAERPRVMAGKLQRMFLLLAWVKGLTPGNLFNEDSE